MPKTIRFYTLGCKVNQYDSEAMLEQFLQSGYIPAKPGDPADVYVVNTCMVTGTGENKSMQAARRFKRQNPNGELIVAGCLAQSKGELLRELGPRLIIGTQYRARIADLFARAMEENSQIVAVESLSSAAFEPLSIHGHQGHTRALMKIQEGCDNRCTFCIVPTVRGGIRSRTIPDIRTEALALREAGFKEVVLTGVHLTSFGRDLKETPSLTDAIRAVAAVDGIERIRLGSLEPVIVTDAFIRDIQTIPKLCPQFHLALQSGSDAVLRRMKRRYNTTQFLAAAKRLKEMRDDVALSTDIIVGFPGETEEEFQQTLAFCNAIGFMKLHVFPYSPRKGTPAADMDGQIAKSVKDARVQALIALGEELSTAYRNRMLQTVQPVLVEEKRRGGLFAGYTPHYIPVVTSHGTIGEIIPLQLTKLHGEGMYGEPANET